MAARAEPSVLVILRGKILSVHLALGFIKQIIVAILKLLLISMCLGETVTFHNIKPKK